MESRNTQSFTSYLVNWRSAFRNWDPPNGAPGPLGPESGVTYVPFSGVNGTTGFTNPRYKDQIRNGQNATTSFSGTKYTAQVEFAHLKWKQITAPNTSFLNSVSTSGRTGETYGQLDYSGYPSGVSIPGNVIADVKNRCIQSFINSCNSARSSFEAGQDLGEFGETLHAIRKPLPSLQGKLTEYLSKLSKAKKVIKSAQTLKRVLAESYLEFRFGWDPLAADVGKAIQDAGRYRFPVIPVRGSAHGSAQALRGKVTVSGGFAIIQPTMSRSLDVEYSCRYKGAIRSGSGDTGQIGFDQAWQLAPSNFIPTAWDLLPWSWVADYFTNVGDCLSALSFVSSNLVWACKTERSSATYKYDSLELPKLGCPQDFHIIEENYQAIGGNANFSIVNVVRSSLNGSDLQPSFSFRVPTSGYPYLNLAAVLFTRFEKLVPFFK